MKSIFISLTICLTRFCRNFRSNTFSLLLAYFLFRLSGTGLWLRKGTFAFSTFFFSCSAFFVALMASTCFFRSAARAPGVMSRLALIASREAPTTARCTFTVFVFLFLADSSSWPFLCRRRKTIVQSSFDGLRRCREYDSAFELMKR